MQSILKSALLALALVAQSCTYAPAFAQTFDVQHQNANAAVDALAGAAERQVAELEATLQQQQDTIGQLQAKLDAIPFVPAGFSDLHLHGDWGAHVDPSIGPWAEGSTYALAQFQKVGDAPFAMKLSVQGVVGKYSDILWSVKRPVPLVGSEHLKFSGRLMTDGNAPNAAQAIEFDTLIIKGGFKYNLSAQINYARNGLLQVATPGGPWQDTPIILGKLAANVFHDVVWEYSYDTQAKTFGFIAFSLDGKRYPLPAQFQNLKPIASNWSEKVHLQLQIDTNSKGLGYSVWWDRLGYQF